MEYGVYGDLIIIYPKPYSIYSRGTSPVNKDIRVWTRGYLAMSGTAGGKGSIYRLEYSRIPSPKLTRNLNRNPMLSAVLGWVATGKISVRSPQSSYSRPSTSRSKPCKSSVPTNITKRRYRGHIGIMEKKMNTTLLYRGIGLIIRRGWHANLYCGGYAWIRREYCP